MATAPRDIKASKADGALIITWSDAETCRYPFHFLRCECRCARCVDERTGTRILDPATVPTDIHVRELSLVGAYALRVDWSDGHNTGLYTWELLQELAKHLSNDQS